MRSKKNQQLAESIIEFYKTHFNDRKATISHFREQNVNVRFIQRALKRFIEEGRVQYKSNPIKKPTVLTNRNLKKIKSRFTKDPSTSVRKIAENTNLSVRTVQRAKNILGIKTRKKSTLPNYINDQEKRCKMNTRKLYKLTTNSGGRKLFVLDDETYVFQNPAECPGIEFYNEASDHPIDPALKSKPKTKFAKKWLVWTAIDSNGMISDATITGEIYRKQ